MFENTELRDVAPPGEVLAEVLEERSMSNAELARRAGLSEKLISQLINVKAPLTQATATLLERVLQIPAALWMNLETAYRTEQQARSSKIALSQFAEWARAFPIREMIKYKFIRDVGRAAVDRVDALLKFFGVGSPDAWEAAWKPVTARFRKSPTFNPNRPALSAWLRQSETVAGHTECQPFSADAFRLAIAKVRAMTMAQPSEFCDSAVQECAAAGVALTFVPSLPGLAINGATRWFGTTRAAIHLSLRHRTDDQLWFSFFHEACHVLEHSSQSIFIDDARSYADHDPVEARANQFARETLLPSAAYEAFISEKHPSLRSLSDVERFAQKHGIAAGIVVGMLQHDEHWPHSRGNALKRRFKWDCE